MPDSPNDFRSNDPLAGPSSGPNPYDAPVTQLRESASSGDELELHREPPPQPHLGWAFLLSIGVIGMQLCLGLGFGMLAVIGNMLAGRPPGELPPWFKAATLQLGTFSTLAAAVVLVAVAFRSAAFRKISWRSCSATQWVLATLCVIPLQIVASEVSNWMLEIELVQQLMSLPGMDELMQGMMNQPWPLLLLGLCVFPGVGEEILFRGLIGRGMVGRHGLILGVLGTSILFGMVHLHPVQAAGAGVIGIGLHCLLLTSRSLLAPIAVHIANNALAFTLMRLDWMFPIPGLNVDPGGDLVLHSPLTMQLAAVLALAGIFTALYQSRTHWILPTGSVWSPGYVTPEIPHPKLHCQPVSQPIRPWLWLLIGIAYAALLASIYAAHLTVA